MAAVSRPSPASGAAIVMVAAGLLSMNRFGGLLTQAPRAFVRLGLVVVWGWVGLGLAIWGTGALIRSRPPRAAGLERTLASLGRAHVPLVALALIMFLSAGALQLRWPVAVATVAVVGWWFPHSLVTGARESGVNSRAASVPVVLTAYAGWLATVGRHLSVQLGHLV